MVLGQKITLHLVEGIPSGIIKGQLDNWVGLVTYAPRTKLDDLAADSDAKRPGVYVLTAPDSEDPTTSIVYIGESENVFTRLKQHERDEGKEFYEAVAVITSTQENLTKGHIRYLESRLIDIAYETDRAIVNNGTRPDLPPLPRADRDEMERFLIHLQMLLPVMGLNFALPLPVRTSSSTNPGVETQLPAGESLIFSISTKEQGSQLAVVANAQQISGEFVVLAGSTALNRNEGHYKDLKDRLIRNGSLVVEGDILKFVKNVPFKSPSAAAAIIRGQNTNGRSYWRLDDGTTYGDWIYARISAEEQLTSDEEV